MTRAERAKQNFLNGWNCTQSVVLAFSDVIGIDEQTAAMLASPFGGGVGRMREMCGTVNGMYIVLGLLKGYSDTSRPELKNMLYKRVQLLAQRFRDENGSIICRELLSGAGVAALTDPNAEPRTPQYYRKRPCAELCACSAGILDDYLKELNDENIDG